jgi:beta-lactamase class A
MSARPVNKESKPKNEPTKQKNFFLKPVPLYILAILFLPLVSLGYFIHQPKKTDTSIKPETAVNYGNYGTCATITRLKDTSLIRPLLFVEINNDDNIASIETKIQNYVEHKKQEGVINTASVYLNDLNTGNHFEINPQELYDPASLMKVPMLLIYLKEAESNPALLKKRYLFEKNQKRAYASTIKDKTLTEGQSYSVEDLLFYMIAYSDNQAFWLLADNIDNHKFEILNQDFDIPLNISHVGQKGKQQNFIASVNSISRFFRVLYSATYLNRKSSIYALKLLSQSTYKDGLLKGIDPNIKVAHKFGERNESGVAELHEFGIVYLKGEPYLLGIMTKGSDLKQLPNILSDISKIAYDEMIARVIKTNPV